MIKHIKLYFPLSRRPASGGTIGQKPEPTIRRDKRCSKGSLREVAKRREGSELHARGV